MRTKPSSVFSGNPVAQQCVEKETGFQFMPGLLRLLQAAAGKAYADAVFLDETSHHWVNHVGLGPLFCYVVQNQLPANVGFTLPQILRSTDMVARVAVAEYLDALEEILAGSADLAQEITLLKGISACQHLYPEPHLRTMGDIDLLVPKNKQAALESLLFSLGYRQQSYRPVEFYSTHHHSMPFVHPRKQTWVEVHTALLSNPCVAADRVFSASYVASQLIPMIFRGHKTNRLNCEQEMIYIATHWALERRCFAGGTIPLTDMLFLIQKYGHTLDWERLLTSLAGSQATVYLNLMLRFLQKHGLVTLPRTQMAKLASAQKYPLQSNEVILHRLIDDYSIRGKRPGRVASEANLGMLWDTLLTQRRAWKNLLTAPWNILFVPTNPRRFSLGFHLMRFFRMLGLHRQ